MRIICIRHGQTTGDVEDRYGGDYDDHLSVEGEKQVVALKEELAEKGIDIFISSSLIRARETTQIISQGEIAMRVEGALRERNQYGILSGLTKAEAKQKYPELVELVKDRLNTIDGVESYEDFSKRIQMIFDAIASDAQYACVGIVWHGGPMRVLFRDILKMGELGKEIGDCGWVELKKEGDDFKIQDSKRIEFLF